MTSAHHALTWTMLWLPIRMRSQRWLCRRAKAKDHIALHVERTAAWIVGKCVKAGAVQVSQHQGFWSALWGDQLSQQEGDDRVPGPRHPGASHSHSPQPPAPDVSSACRICSRSSLICLSIFAADQSGACTASCASVSRGGAGGRTPAAARRARYAALRVAPVSNLALQLTQTRPLGEPGTDIFAVRNLHVCPIQTLPEQFIYTLKCGGYLVKPVTLLCLHCSEIMCGCAGRRKRRAPAGNASTNGTSSTRLARST